MGIVGARYTSYQSKQDAPPASCPMILEEFDALVGRPGYHLCENGDLERREGSLVYLIVRQQRNQALPVGE